MVEIDFVAEAHQRIGRRASGVEAETVELEGEFVDGMLEVVEVATNLRPEALDVVGGHGVGYIQEVGGILIMKLKGQELGGSDI